MQAEGPDLYRADHHPQVGADILALPTSQLQRLALIRISQLTRGELRGAPLEAMARHPDLSDCRKLYFDESQNEIRTVGGRAPAWRIVYRLRDALPGPDARLLLQVVAVGARPASEVYELAGARLDRQRIVRAPVPQTTPAPASAAPGRRSLAEAQRLAVEPLRRTQGRRR
ncbi:hypothetical protein ACFC58_34605 [Kitasatospora purpeofusca]|uniref:hypothetical protein n=1 Tax=Kitasatospora purpeofusca TaxID=67352 RepID=UPI0035DA41BE